MYGILHTYVVYPLMMLILTSGRKLKHESYSLEELPAIDIIIAAHNEEKVIQKKIESIFNSEYPPEKINVYIIVQ